MAKVTQEHLDARRKAIRLAALEVLAVKGVEGATMHDIAERAGLSSGAIYNYYPGKEELLRDVFEVYVELHRKASEEVIARTNSPTGAILALAQWEPDSELAEIHEHKSLLGMQLVIAASHRETGVADMLQNAFEAGIELVTDLVERAQEKGEISRDVDTRGLAMLLICCQEGLHHLLLPVMHDRVKVQPVLDMIGEILRALAPGVEEVSQAKG